MTLEQAEHLTILRSTVGSTIHGVSLEGNEDRDEAAVCIEPIEMAMGIHAPFEQLVYRTAAIREGKHDAPSQPGDLDLTIYSLRKYLRLALKGNPTILLLLFAPPLRADARGTALLELAPDIISRQAGKAFLGYMQAQRQRLTGERGQKRVNRPELEEKYGFDTKYAMHVLRLGCQGTELLRTGRLQLPMGEEDRAYLLNVRRGEVEFNDVLTKAGELEAELKDLLDTSFLPEEPNVAKVEDWMLTMYQRAWSARQHDKDIMTTMRLRSRE